MNKKFQSIIANAALIAMVFSFPLQIYAESSLQSDCGEQCIEATHDHVTDSTQAPEISDSLPQEQEPPPAPPVNPPVQPPVNPPIQPPVEEAPTQPPVEEVPPEPQAPQDYPASYTEYFSQVRPFLHIDAEDTINKWTWVNGTVYIDASNGFHAVIDNVKQWRASGSVRFLLVDNSKLYMFDSNGQSLTLLYESATTIQQMEGNSQIVFFLENNILYRIHIESGIIDLIYDLGASAYFKVYDSQHVIWDYDVPHKYNEKGENIQPDAIIYFFYSNVEKAIMPHPHDMLSSTSRFPSVNEADDEPAAASFSMYSSLPSVTKHIMGSYSNGTYFSKDGGPCSCHPKGYNNCLSIYNTPACNCKWENGGIQCWGFATTVYKDYWGHTQSGAELVTFPSGTDEMTKLLALPVGAWVRSRNDEHSWIVMGKSASGITVYDANNPYSCQVSIETLTYEQAEKRTLWIISIDSYFIPTTCSSHAWSNWATVDASTCARVGLEGRVCTGCGVVQQRSIALAAHSYSSATCTAAAKCNNCPATNGSSLGHSTTSATCTTPSKCTRCNTTFTASLGHNDVRVSAGAASTCTVAGYDVYKCSRCERTTTKPLGLKAHSYAAATCTASAKCNYCSATIGSASGHSYIRVDRVSPSCTAKGSETYRCNRCTSYYTTSLSALGHSTSVLQCTATRCSRCGTVFGSIAHNWVTIGERKQRCTKCNITRTV